MNSKQKGKGKWLLVLLSMVLFAGCEKVVYQPIEITNDTIYFSTDIQPIFNANCLDCHDPNNSGRNPYLIEGSSYNALVPKYVSVADTATPESSKFYLKMTGSHTDRTTPIEKQTFLMWIKQGVRNN
jgi:hypothetical protein